MRYQGVEYVGESVERYRPTEHGYGGSDGA
jgi:hypothetical protein